MLLVVSMVAGVLAVRQAKRADRAAVAADARRVGAQALLADDVDRSLLLAVEAVRLDDSSDTRANLMAALAKNPALIASTRGDSTGFISLELSPDGEVAASGRAWSGLSFFSTQHPGAVGHLRRGGGLEDRHLVPTASSSRSAPRRSCGYGQARPEASVRLVDVATFKDAPVSSAVRPGTSARRRCTTAATADSWRRPSTTPRGPGVGSGVAAAAGAAHQACLIQLGRPP